MNFPLRIFFPAGTRPSVGGRRARSCRWGFSLIEVSLALGVTAFAIMAVLGMLPNSMSQFRRAVDLSVSSQVIQRIAAQSRQADFSEVVKAAGERTIYFNDQGEEVGSPDSSTYAARVRIEPQAVLPGASQAAESLTVLAIEVYASFGRGILSGQKPLATSAALIAGNPAMP